MNYIHHIVADMDETMMQHCILCGAVISDYRNVMYPADQGPPKGWSAGELYVSEGTNPTYYLRHIRPEDTSRSCVEKYEEKRHGKGCTCRFCMENIVK